MGVRARPLLAAWNAAAPPDATAWRQMEGCRPLHDGQALTTAARQAFRQIASQFDKSADWPDLDAAARRECHCVAADGGVPPPPRRARRPFPHGLPALSGGPVERHHQDRVASPPWFAVATKSPPCALVALGNVLLPRPQPSALAVLPAKRLHWRSNGVENKALPL